MKETSFNEIEVGARVPRTSKLLLSVQDLAVVRERPDAYDGKDSIPDGDLNPPPPPPPPPPSK
jgi:hypothetical protein